ncbi:MAG: hypothetical protein R3313_01515 [Candidatus Saccharimonadales bacterium]|nr:hypothetical protein [Candidatus Saccharimonadales bacterium]
MGAPTPRAQELEYKIKPYLRHGEFEWQDPWLDASRRHLHEASRLAIMNPTDEAVRRLKAAMKDHSERIASLAKETRSFGERSIDLDVIGPHIGAEFEKIRKMVEQSLADEILNSPSIQLDRPEEQPAELLPPIDPDFWLNEFWLEFESKTNLSAADYPIFRMRDHLNGLLTDKVYGALPYEFRVFEPTESIES